MYDIAKQITFSLNGAHHHMYTTDKHHVMLGCNHSQAIDVGLNCSEEIIGRSIFELYPKTESTMLLANNEEVLRSGQPRFFEEFAVIASGKVLVYSTYKIPLKNEKDKTIGVMGISVPVQRERPTETLLIQFPELASLTPQQQKCFNFIVQGWSTKEIAQKMKLSPRTIEHYLAQIKSKLECKNIKELIIRYSSKI